MYLWKYENTKWKRNEKRFKELKNFWKHKIIHTVFLSVWHVSVHLSKNQSKKIKNGLYTKNETSCKNWCIHLVVHDGDGKPSVFCTLSRSHKNYLLFDCFFRSPHNRRQEPLTRWSLRSDTDENRLLVSINPQNIPLLINRLFSMVQFLMITILYQIFRIQYNFVVF